jgi:ArsR family transcriptional regulator
VELRQGELESLPIDSGDLDVAMLSLVLHYSPAPPRALAEVGRVVRTGGRVLVVDMLPHDREEYQQQMGHVWLGFSENRFRASSPEQGLVRCASGCCRPIRMPRGRRYSQQSPSKSKSTA